LCTGKKLVQIKESTQESKSQTSQQERRCSGQDPPRSTNQLRNPNLANGVAEEDPPHDSLEVFRPPDEPAPKPLNFPFPRTRTATIEASLQREQRRSEKKTLTEEEGGGSDGGRWWQRERRESDERETREEKGYCCREGRGEEEEKRGLTNLVP